MDRYMSYAVHFSSVVLGRFAGLTLLVALGATLTSTYL
jgi:hypothetical protein